MSEQPTASTTSQQTTESISVSTAGRRLAVGLGLLFGLASLIRDAILLKAFGFDVWPDTRAYLDGSAMRSRPYPIMTWLTDAADHPLILIWLQIVLGAVAVAILVYVVARRNRWLAALIGLLLAFDMVWATANLTILSEGPFTSFSVIALAVLVAQYENRHRLRPPFLIAAGGLYAWTCTIRPSNLYLLVVVALAYLVFTRSVPKVAWLAGGMALVLLATSGLTWYQTGYFRLNGGTGYYLAFPLFSYHLFDPANGTQSKRIDTTLRSCDPSVDYSQVTILTSNQYLWGEFFGCLQRSGWSSDQVDTALTSAYVEGIRAQPGTAIYNWFGWTSIELGLPLLYAQSQSPCDPANFSFCDDLLAQVRDARPELQSSAAVWSQVWASRTAPVRQVYVEPVWATHPADLNDPYATMDKHALSVRYLVMIWLICVAALALLYFRTRGSVRLLGFAAATLVGYVCLTSVMGAVFLPRYISVLSPIEAVLSAILIFVGFRLVVELALWLGVRLALTAAASAAALAAVLYLLVPPPALALLVGGALPSSATVQLYGYALAASLIAVGVAAVIRLRGRSVRTLEWKWPASVDETGV